MQWPQTDGQSVVIQLPDPATIGPAVPEIVEDLPGGGKRLSQRAEGFEATIVAGEITIRKGEATGRRPGRLIRNRLARSRRKTKENR